MKLRMMIPAMALAAFGAACEDKEDPASVNGGMASVRFVNAVQGSTGNVLLTSNGSAVGSAQGFGSAGTTCSQVSAGNNRTLAFGTAGTGNTISNQFGTTTTNLTANGNFTVIATGTTTSPTLLVLNNQPTTAATGSNANVRFVNATGSIIDFFATSGATLGTATFANVSGRSVANLSTNQGFTTVATGSNTLTFRTTGTTAPLFQTTLTGTSAFQAGQNYTVVLMPNAAGTGFQTLVLQGC